MTAGTREARDSLATLALALATSLLARAFGAKAPESTRYSDFGSRIVVRGGR